MSDYRKRQRSTGNPLLWLLPLLLVIAGAVGAVWYFTQRKTGEQAQTQQPTGTSGAKKYSARELWDVYKLGKDVNGERVEVRGFVRAVEADRGNPKLVLEGGDGFTDIIEVYCDGALPEPVSRSDTATVTANVKGKGKGSFGEVVMLTDAKLLKVEKKPKK